MNVEHAIASARRTLLQRMPPPPSTDTPSSDDDTPRDDNQSLFACCVHLRDFDADTHKPHVLFPCGHTVCEETCQRETRCPVCRTPFRNHALNRNLMHVLEAMRDAADHTSDLPHDKNTFLKALQHHHVALQHMVTAPCEWTVEQRQVFRDLVDAMKTHANTVTRTWIDASGCHARVAAELRRALQKIKRVSYNRVRLGWGDVEGLPLCI